MPGPGLRQRFYRFWQRITEGLQLNELWQQFRADARSSYRFYSQGVDSSRLAGVSHTRRASCVARQFFWSIVEKLTPARRVLLLIALAHLFSNLGGSWQSNNVEVRAFWFGSAFWGGLLLLLLLLMEVGDRVVMKRDLQIAKEIQAWLLPAAPPQVPGLAIAFATRPANTVAGDYYNVFPRPGCPPESPAFLIAVADVAGKSVPAAMLMATFQASLKTLSDSPGSTRGKINNRLYAAGEVVLQPGDWLANFTDGVIEAENNLQQQYGEDRFLVMLRWGSTLPPAALLAAILADIARFAGNAPQHDDITCMLLRSV